MKRHSTYMPTIVQTVLDHKTQKVIPHYGDKSVFVVCVKRHNTKKKPVFMGNGFELNVLLTKYHEIEVFKSDRKYLTHRFVEETPEEARNILMENGQGKMRLHMGHRGRKKIEYKTSSIALIQNIPASIPAGISKFLSKGIEINSSLLTKTRLMGIILADFLERSEEERVKMLSKADLYYEKHKYNCGGEEGIVEKIEKKVMTLEAKEEEEDLL